MLNPANEDQWRYKRVVGVPVGLFVAAVAAAPILGFAAAGVGTWYWKPAAPPMVLEAASLQTSTAADEPAKPDQPDAQRDPPTDGARPANR